MRNIVIGLVIGVFMYSGSAYACSAPPVLDVSEESGVAYEVAQGLIEEGYYGLPFDGGEILYAPDATLADVCDGTGATQAQVDNLVEQGYITVDGCIYAG